MSNKMSCPACKSYTSGIYNAYYEDGACPVCGLSNGVMRAVREAEAKWADTELNTKYQDALVDNDKLRMDLEAHRIAYDKLRRLVSEALEEGAKTWPQRDQWASS